MELPRWHLCHRGHMYPIYRADIEGVEYTYTGEFNFVHEEDKLNFLLRTPPLQPMKFNGLQG